MPLVCVRVVHSQVVLDEVALTQAYEREYEAGNLDPNLYIGRPKGSGGLRRAWPPLEVETWKAQLEYWLTLEPIKNLVQAERAKLQAVAAVSPPRAVSPPPEPISPPRGEASSCA